jgi:hypothetical protein
MHSRRIPAFWRSSAPLNALSFRLAGRERPLDEARGIRGYPINPNSETRLQCEI